MVAAVCFLLFRISLILFNLFNQLLEVSTCLAALLFDYWADQNINCTLEKYEAILLFDGLKCQFIDDVYLFPKSIHQGNHFKKPLKRHQVKKETKSIFKDVAN